jgi:hypothetical protein
VGFKVGCRASESNCRIPVHVAAATALHGNDERAEEKRTLNSESLIRSPGPSAMQFLEYEKNDGPQELINRVSAKKRHFWMPSRAWRSGLEPAELSFRVPHFFHQTRKGPRGAMVLNNAHFIGIQKLITDSTSTDSKSKGATGFSDQSWMDAPSTRLLVGSLPRQKPSRRAPDPQ